MSSGSDTSGEGGSKRGRGQNDSSLLKDIKALIDGSEERKVGKIDEKIDGLSERIYKRMEAGEKDVKKLGRNVRELKGDRLNLAKKVDQNKEDVVGMIDRAVSEKVVAMGGPRPRVGGPRPKGDMAIADLTKANKYQDA